MKPLTLKQKRIYDYISSYNQENGYAPSLEEIANYFNLKAISTVHEHVRLLKEKGYIKKEDFQSRSVAPLENNMDIIEIPLLGKISAGVPVDIVDDEDGGYVEVPNSMIKSNSNYYALKVEGDSMIDDDVWDKDIILIKYQKTAEIGDMVVAIVKEQATLKRLGEIDDSKVKLIPRNPRYPAFDVSLNEFEIRGKFVGLIRRGE